MGRLQELNMHEGWIYEALVSTFTDGEPHATPIGVWTDDLTTLHMEIFDSSRTLNGLLDTKYFAANFPNDVSAFHVALFHPDLLSFEPAPTIPAPLLCGASATVELALSEATPAKDRVRVTGSVVGARASEGLRLINRADGLLVESLILATRMEYLDDAAVRRSLAENYRVIRKVAPGSKSERAMTELMRDIGTRTQPS